MNDYAKSLGKLFNDSSKEEIAAIAVSYLIMFSGDDELTDDKDICKAFVRELLILQNQGILS